MIKKLVQIRFCYIFLSFFLTKKIPTELTRPIPNSTNQKGVPEAVITTGIFTPEAAAKPPAVNGLATIDKFVTNFPRVFISILTLTI